MKKNNLGKLALWIVAIVASSLTSFLTAQDNLKILSYNVLDGMKSDSTENKQLFAEWIEKQAPDIVAFQEMNFFTQKKLEEFARSYGHPYAVILKEEGYPVALTSKYPIVNVWKVIDNMHHGFVQARIKDMNIIVLHLSPFRYEKRNEEIDLILETIDNYPSGERWMVMGDFNSISSLDADYYSAAVAERMRVRDAEFAHLQNLREDGSLDYEVHEKMKRNNFVDVLKEIHAEFITTCPTKRYIRGDRKDAGTRIDYIYVSDNMKSDIQDAYVVKDAFTDFYSDHYPMVLELEK